MFILGRDWLLHGSHQWVLIPGAVTYTTSAILFNVDGLASQAITAPPSSRRFCFDYPNDGVISNVTLFPAAASTLYNPQWSTVPHPWMPFTPLQHSWRSRTCGNESSIVRFQSDGPNMFLVGRAKSARQIPGLAHQSRPSISQ